MLFKTAGHTLLFNDEVIATFYHDGVAEGVAKTLNYPHTESELRNQLWVITSPLPEGVPAERKLIGPAHAHLDAPCTDRCYEQKVSENEQ